MFKKKKLKDSVCVYFHDRMSLTTDTWKIIFSMAQLWVPHTERTRSEYHLLAM